MIKYYKMDIKAYKPKGRIENKHLLTLKNYSPQEIFEILYLAKKLKKQNKAKEKSRILAGKTVALIFAKASTRTRVSFEMGIAQLGGNSLFLSANDIQLGRGETISDTVQVLERYGIDAIMIRTFAQKDVEDLAKYGTIPVINGLTDECHPCQALADLLTIWEYFGSLAGKKLAYFGDGNNMANSLLIAGAKCGMQVSVACPKNHPPNEEYFKIANQYSIVEICHDPIEAAKNADVLYTDVFFSMGQRAEQEKHDELMRFQVNSELMKKAKETAIFLHCLPAHRGEEVTAEVIDGPQSKIFEQAENRLHAQKAVLSLLLR